MIQVVKIGGNVIDNPELLRKFIKDFAAIEGPKILVHGGGKAATELSKQLGMETKMVNGRRITDAVTIDVVTMVYAGMINKRLVALLQSVGCQALGLCGADADVVPATRRPAHPIDFGLVGDIDPEKINARFILDLIDKGITPVFCSINHDGKGNMLNCNADTQASSIAIACSKLQPTILIYCFEKPGVLEDVTDEGSVVELITPDVYQRMKNEGKIVEGMLPKIDNAFLAVNSGLESVVIKSAENLDKTLGTTIRN